MVNKGQREKYPGKNFQGGGITMANKITWETDMKVALTKAKKGNKHIFLDFFNPG